MFKKLYPVYEICVFFWCKVLGVDSSYLNWVFYLKAGDFQKDFPARQKVTIKGHGFLSTLRWTRTSNYPDENLQLFSNNNSFWSISNIISSYNKTSEIVVDITCQLLSHFCIFNFFLKQLKQIWPFRKINPLRK